MKCNVKLDVTDAQRNALAQLLTGKAVKRLATREEVAAYVFGAIEGLTQPVPEAEPAARPVAQAQHPAASLTPAEEAEVKRLLAQGKTLGYCRGWIAVGRSLATKMGTVSQ